MRLLTILNNCAIVTFLYVICIPLCIFDMVIGNLDVEEGIVMIIMWSIFPAIVISGIFFSEDIRDYVIGNKSVYDAIHNY